MREERVNDQARSHKEVDRRTFTFEARDVLDRQHRRGPVGRFCETSISTAGEGCPKKEIVWVPRETFLIGEKASEGSKDMLSPDQGTDRRPKLNNPHVRESAHPERVRA